MKKAIITAALAAVSAAVFGQGQVQFTTYNASADTITGNGFSTFNSPVYVDQVGGTKISGTQGRIEMIGAALAGGVGTSVKTDGSQVLGNLADLYNSATTTLTWVNFGTATAGAVSKQVGYASVGSTTTRILPTVAYGGSALVQVVAWYGSTAANYSTWQQAFNAAYGIGVAMDTGLKIGASSPMTVTHTSTSSSDPNVPIPSFSSFAVISVPEPTTAAIAGLGLASMLIFRRKKA